VNVDARDTTGAIRKTSVLVGPQGILGRYEKMRLVPFGEYIPFRRFLEPLTWITRAAPEDRRRGHSLVVMHADGTAFSPLICFESAFPDMSRRVALDGADFNDPLQGNQRGGNDPVFFFPLAAVREFQVVRSGLDAEVGRTNAGFVNAVTKSGTNDWHGEGFYMNRNEDLTSPDAFGNPALNMQHQFGGALGGHIKKDRTFFFVAAEQNFLNLPFTVQFQPQPAGVTLPASLLALQGEQEGTNNVTSAFGRLDHSLTSKHMLNVDFLYANLDAKNFALSPRTNDISEGTNFDRQGSSAATKVSLVSAFSSSLLNELRGQYATDYRFEEPNVQSAMVVITGVGTFGTEVTREVAGGRLEGALRDAHPVVHGPCLRVVEIEPDDRSALAHQGERADGQRLQRVRRDLERDGDVLPRRGEEPAAEARLGGEPDGVEHAVQAAADAAGERVDILRVAHVELDDLRRRWQSLGRPSRQAHHPPERREHDLGALFLGQLRDPERHRRVVEDAGDEDSLSVEEHPPILPQSGEFECRRDEGLSCFVSRRASAAPSARRVSAGAMTSST